MKMEIAQEIISMIETEAEARPTPMEFELAYQARVAADRIRFAIKEIEQARAKSDHSREIALQLLDALERLESSERRFQTKSRRPASVAPESTVAGGGDRKSYGADRSCGTASSV